MKYEYIADILQFFIENIWKRIVYDHQLPTTLFFIKPFMDGNSPLLDSSMLGAYRDTVAAQRRNSSGGIPPVKCRHLTDRSCTSGAIRRTDHALVSPPGGQVTN